MGWMLDNNIAMESILLMAASTVIVGVALAYIGLKDENTASLNFE
jgi:hypothetical protein